MEGCLNRGWGPILLGLPSLYARQPISGRTVELGFSHRSGRCRPGTPRFSIFVHGCRSCRDIEGCLNRGWVPILPGCDGTGRGLPRGQLPPHTPRPLIGRGRAGGGGALGQWDRGSKNAEIKVIKSYFVCLLYYYISRYPFWFALCFPSGILSLQGDWSLSCDHGLDYAS